jgi:hypothetical protein
LFFGVFLLLISRKEKEKKNTYKGRKNGSGATGPAYQVQGPEFKPQYHQKEKHTQANGFSSSLNFSSSPYPT